MFYITVRRIPKDGREEHHVIAVSDQDSARVIYNRFGDWLADLQDDGKLEWYAVELSYSK